MELQVQYSTGTLMEISEEVLRSIRMQIRPKEACGILTVNLKVYPITNVSAYPDRFVMKKSEYVTIINRIKDSGEEVLAIYHTHPLTSPVASADDLEYFKKSQYDMLIVSPKEHEYYAKDNR